jgi:hypothetical protein
MVYAQTVKIPADHRVSITLDVPREIPAGATARFEVVWHVPGEDAPRDQPPKSAAEIVREMREAEPTPEELKERAAAQYAAWKDSGIDPLEEWRDSLKGKKIFGGVDGVAYQRSIRDEWPD